MFFVIRLFFFFFFSLWTTLFVTRFQRVFLLSGLCPNFSRSPPQRLLESSSLCMESLQFGVLLWSINRTSIGFKRLRNSSVLYVQLRSFLHYSFDFRLFGIPAEFFVTLYMNNGHEWKWWLNWISFSLFSFRFCLFSL